MKKNVCLYAMMALAVMGCSQNNKKQEGSSKGLPSCVESESKAGAEKADQSVAGSSNQSASAGKVQVLTASDFRKKIMDYESHPEEWVFAGSRPAIIDFYTTWCGPCKMMHPVLEQLKEDLGDSIRILKIDVDKNEALSEAYRIQSVPTLMLFKEGKQLWRQSGAMRMQDLKNLIAKYQ